MASKSLVRMDPPGLPKPRSTLPKAGAAPTADDLLDKIVPPQRFTDGANKEWVQRISSTPATRVDVVALAEALDQRLRQRGQAGADFDHALAAGRGDGMHDRIDDAAIGQKVLAEAFARLVLHMHQALARLTHLHKGFVAHIALPDHKVFVVAAGAQRVALAIAQLCWCHVDAASLQHLDQVHAKA